LAVVPFIVKLEELLALDQLVAGLVAAMRIVGVVAKVRGPEMALGDLKGGEGIGLRSA
jgi:hypothetical protein